MKVLQVIHGYPPYYMAGSEIYTYNLSNELAMTINVYVFTRTENPYEPPYTKYDERIKQIKVRRINKPQRNYTLIDKYQDPKMDDEFRQYMSDIEPDIVHFGHLSHLSTNLINIAKDEFNKLIIYTIHNFWLFCYRGQLVDPSVWYENSPLVIQEAFLAGIPVITTDLGGMKELVKDGKDGFLFELGDVASLRNIFERIANNPTILNELEVDPGKVKSIREDAEFVLYIYREVML